MNRYFLFAEITPWYDLDGRIKREVYANSVRGEEKLRERIKELLLDETDTNIRVIYGNDITSQFIEKGEENEV